jgi:hypothetical protein
MRGISEVDTDLTDGKRADEIQPYVVYRIDGAQLECALWQFKDGQKALALFLSGDTATSYQQAIDRAGEWKIFRPERHALLQMLKACHEGGIAFACSMSERKADVSRQRPRIARGSLLTVGAVGRGAVGADVVLAERGTRR